MNVIDISVLIPALWDAVKIHVPDKKQEDTAISMIESLIKNDVIEDINELETALGSDPTLDEAIKLVLEDYSDNQYDEEDTDNYNEED